MSTIQSRVRSLEIKCLGWVAVEEIGACVKGFHSLGCQNAGPKLWRTHNIICGMDNTFGVTILGEV
jgi:hypothetical protein